MSASVAAVGAESLCSRYSTSRGPGQRVLSFALYGLAVHFHKCQLVLMMRIALLSYGNL